MDSYGALALIRPDGVQEPLPQREPGQPLSGRQPGGARLLLYDLGSRTTRLIRRATERDNVYRLSGWR